MIRVTEALPRDVMIAFNFRRSLTEEERGLPLDDVEVCELLAEVSSAFYGDRPTVLLAWKDDLPIGAVWCYGYPLIGRNDGKTMRVDMLYIVPEYRQTRTLRALWDAVHQLADKYGIEKMQGTVTEKNSAVKRMWVKRGAYVRAEILEKKHVVTKHGAEEFEQAAAQGEGPPGSDRAGHQV